ncbi:MAG: SMP-30/gluconolactonase/LRE family protein, partial [bacterium]|nr:SMP-30/gluconolactonase/LRE family protein [bacterium]
MIATYDAGIATDEVFILGEGPTWDAPRSRVLWVDITAGWVLVGRLEGPRIRIVERLEFAGTVSAVTVARDGSLLVAGAE